MKKVCVILAEGFEEIEAISVIDILRRCGLHVDLLGVGNTKITGSHEITIICDEIFDFYSASDFDGVILVGGMKNAKLLSSDNSIFQLLNKYFNENKLVAGICATPSIVFSKCSWFKGIPSTCYPSEDLKVNLGNNFINEKIVVSNNVITSQSPSTAFDFAIEIAKYFGYDVDDLKSSLRGDI